jgi:hypothetical protein
LKITPQRVLFNDEDFHSVKILETVVRQFEVLAHRKNWFFCKVTPVSIQTFVEGLLGLANVSEATHYLEEFVTKETKSFKMEQRLVVMNLQMLT